MDVGCTKTELAGPRLEDDVIGTVEILQLLSDF